MVVNVDQIKILHGKRNSSTMCPIALALMEQFHCGSDDVSVGIDNACVFDRHTPLPTDAMTFISNFDEGTNEVTEFKFELPDVETWEKF